MRHTDTTRSRTGGKVGCPPPAPSPLVSAQRLCHGDWEKPRYNLSQLLCTSLWIWRGQPRAQRTDTWMRLDDVSSLFRVSSSVYSHISGSRGRTPQSRRSMQRGRAPLPRARRAGWGLRRMPPWSAHGEQSHFAEPEPLVQQGFPGASTCACMNGD